jgi:uncharacterized delta-60 repeat protein
MKKTILLAALGLLAAVVFGFGPPLAQAAVAEAWVHRYSNVVSNSNDQAFKVVRDAAGDIIVTGTTDDGIHGPDMLTIKYSGTDGSVIWQERYNGPANSYDVAQAVAVNGSGNVVVTGYSNNGTNYDAYTAKYAAGDGALLWEKRYNSPANRGDFTHAVALDGSGNVVVTGSSENRTNSDYYTAKYAAADGALLWEKRYNGPATNYNNDYASAVVVDGSGNVVVTGSSFNGASGYDCYTAKYAAADGALLWEQRCTNGNATAVALDNSGNAVVTGNSSNDYYTAKYAAADGALLWEKRYNGPRNADDRANALAVDGSGNVLVTGYSDNDAYTAKYAAADGALLWEQRYNSPANQLDLAHAVALDGSGNVVVTGYSYSTSFNADYFTAKYAAANGALLWEKRYNGPANRDDEAQALAVDGGGNVVVTGSSRDSRGADYYTAKYAAANGALLWEQRYNGLSKSYNEANAVVVDGSGNLVVTGYSEGSGSSGDYYTAKYAAADGALIWEQRSNGGGQAVAVDGCGNVVVTGSSRTRYDEHGNWLAYDYYTAKYAAADGALLWEKRYNGSGNYYDSASAVAVDGGGNVVVTGYSYNTNFSADYYTVKYAAADGALLWEQRATGNERSSLGPAVAIDGSGNVVVAGVSDFIQYLNPPWEGDYYTAKYAAVDGALLWEKHYNGPARSFDQAQAVAVDGTGNVVVTGRTGNLSGEDGFSESDYYTAKYAAADGTLLWEKRYNGPANGDDWAYAVAVDRSGNVLVTGTTDGDGFGSGGDYYTAKYAAANGALLWEHRYNGPSNGSDAAQAIALDCSGNVVVTGISSNGTNDDYYTAKYASADGMLLWEKRYNGPVNEGDRVSGSHSVALGRNGIVAITGTSSSDYATVLYRDDVDPVSIALVPTGIRLRFTGIPGRSYTIEHAPAVTGPWTTLNIQTTPASGLLEHIDATLPVGSAFYRTVQP